MTPAAGEQVAGAVAGSTAAMWIGDFVLQLVGVPFPVVVAAAAGAGLARAFDEPVGFMRALGLAALWTAIGCTCAPLAQAIIPALVHAVFNREIVLQANALAGIAAMLSSCTWWGPRVWPLIANRFTRQPPPSGPVS